MILTNTSQQQSLLEKCLKECSECPHLYFSLPLMGLCKVLLILCLLLNLIAQGAPLRC